MGMNTNKLAKITGFSTHGAIAYGSMNGISFNAIIADMTGICTITCFIKREEGINLASINAFLEANHRKYKNARAAFNGMAVAVTIPNFIKLNAQLISEFLHEFSQFLRDNNYYSSGCNHCGKTDDLGYTLQGGQIIEICADCHDKISHELADIKHERETAGSYMTGAIGAILGGILGIIPWILLDQIGFIASISGLIMGFLAQKGYLILRGKRGRGMLIIIAAVLIVFTYVAVLINQTIYDYTYLIEEGYADVSAIRLFFLEITFPFDYMNYDVGSIWGQLGLGWLFAALGSFSILRDVYRTGKGRDLEAKRIK